MVYKGETLWESVVLMIHQQIITMLQHTAFVQQHMIHRKFKVALFLQKVIENRERGLPISSHPQESTRAELTHTEVTDTRLLQCRAPRTI